MNRHFSPTTEQKAVIEHQNSAYITACPGAGKTRTMVERARLILNQTSDRRGVAFLSFTNAAVTELETKLRSFNAFPNPLFPSFIGTFDRFLWQFIISPFGLPNSPTKPTLIPDKCDWEIKPFANAFPLTLGDFDRATGNLVPLKLQTLPLNVKNKTAAYETAARTQIKNSMESGLLDFEDIRAIVQRRLSETTFAESLGRTLLARFSEIIVDEAQDCNPSDLEIANWLLNSGITLKLICDPNQSIYKFRGGVTEELKKFAERFNKNDHLVMSGNFRSSPNICSAIVALRAPALRLNPDCAVGKNKEVSTPVHIISYSGSGVPPTLSTTFEELLNQFGISATNAPILAATRSSAFKATGRQFHPETKHSTLLLADTVTRYHYSFIDGKRQEALIELHKVVLKIRGKIENLADYNLHMRDAESSVDWRSEIMSIANSLRFTESDTPDCWLTRARDLLNKSLEDDFSINQRLKKTSDLASRLEKSDPSSLSARTIHSVKGLEFPAVCIVMTTNTAAGILNVLYGLHSEHMEEDARKLYVGASRAEKLLAIAIPKSQSERLKQLLEEHGCEVTVKQI